MHQFDDVAIHSAEAESLTTGNNRETVTFLSDEEITLKPHRKWKANEYTVQATQVRISSCLFVVLNFKSVYQEIFFLPR
jgi:hypothetical protein